MSDTNRHWMGSPKRVNKLVSRNSDVAKQREFFKRQEARTKSSREKEMKEKEGRKKDGKGREGEKEVGFCEPPRKRFDIGMSMNMLALCEDFKPLELVEIQQQQKDDDEGHKNDGKEK